MMHNKISSTLFHIGNVLLLLIGIAHLIGHFSGELQPTNESQKQLLELLNTTLFEMPTGEMRTFSDITNAFSLYFAIFPIAMALILWVVSRDKIILFRSLIIAVLMLISTSFVTYKYAILPPLVLMLVAAICFIGSLITMKSSEK